MEGANSQRALSYFSRPAVLLFLGMFLVGGGRGSNMASGFTAVNSRLKIESVLPDSSITESNLRSGCGAFSRPVLLISFGPFR